MKYERIAHLPGWARTEITLALIRAGVSPENRRIATSGGIEQLEKFIPATRKWRLMCK